MLRFVPLQAVRVTDAFWKARQRLVREAVLPYQWEMLNDRVPEAEPSHCVHNFLAAAGRAGGAFQGTIFLDSDLYKWLEAVAYCLAVERDEALEALADGAVELIAAAQQPDGYLDNYYTLMAPEARWTNLMEGHELYCAGHFIEAAVAYTQATGKKRALEIAAKLADCLERAFSPAMGNHPGYPGHPEIELALLRLCQATGEERYLRLARHFVDVRGAGEESYFARERQKRGGSYVFPEMARFGDDYFQAHQPVRRQRQAAGHAVRALYLYSAMADIALCDGDEGLKQACAELFANVTQRQMYVTGGVGAAALGERFTTDYDLPNDSVYAETCASVGLMRFARRMFLLTGSESAFDVWERALYNTVLAGMGKDGRHFFYVNPLAVTPDFAAHNPTLEHVKTVRQKWFGVACCPPNIARALASLGGSLYAADDDRLYVLSHIASSFAWEGKTVALSKDGDGWRLAVDAPPMEIILRKPDGYRLEGERRIAHPGGRATYSYRLLPELRFLRAHPRVEADAGKVCVLLGETVYCAEEADNGKGLAALYADTSLPPVETALSNGMPALRCAGWRRLETDALYSAEKPAYQPVSILLVPYAQWNNRGEGEMRVWLNEAAPVPR